MSGYDACLTAASALRRNILYSPMAFARAAWKQPMWRAAFAKSAEVWLRAFPGGATMDAYFSPAKEAVVTHAVSV